MQIKDGFLLSKKQLEDEKICEINLKYELHEWFENVCNLVLNKIKNNPSILFFEVENIVKDHKDEYLEILSENIHDFYVNVSEVQEAKINNKVAQKSVDNILILETAIKDKQDSLDEWLYDYSNTDKINEKIRKNLRYNNNIQSSLDRYIGINNRTNLKLGIQPTSFQITELMEFQVDEAVVEYMSSNVFVASEVTLERVTQEIYDIIREKYAEEGEGTYPTADAIQEKFTELADYEAERIARTETLKAQGHATWQRLVNNENVEYYQWLSTNDERTRESHVELNGEITFADGSGIFSNGLRFPGDTEGDIEEWINCRCDLIAYIADVGMVPPFGATSWFEDEMLFDTSLEIPEVYVELEEYLASYW